MPGGGLTLAEDPGAQNMFFSVFDILNYGVEITHDDGGSMLACLSVVFA